jgi:chlorobactene glucosyltransferase
MIFQVFVLAVLLLFALNLIFNLIALKRTSKSTKMTGPFPMVSILVPARNEAANIGKCISSLIKQDYPDYEVVVLDDNSTDNTAAIVASLQETDPRLRLIHGQPLTPGWAGKPFACHQLATEARGSWLLFIDADTDHKPYMLRSVIALAVREKLSLLSGMPRQVTSGLPQKIVMPLMYFILLSWFPIWFLNNTRRPWPTLAIGQFMLFPKEEYWRVGGHAAVKDRIIEDVWFGAEIKKAGGRFIAADLSNVMSTDMYQSVETMSEGWGKWMYSVMALSPFALAGFFAAAYFFFLAPYFWLVHSFVIDSGPSDWKFVVLAQVIVLILMRWAADHRFKEPAGSFIFHPLGIIFLVLVAIYSAARRAVGVGVAWKGRVYDGRSQVK